MDSHGIEPQTPSPCSNTGNKTHERYLIANSKRDGLLDRLWVYIGPEDTIPDGEGDAEVRIVIRRVVSVVNMMVSRRDHYPFEPVRPPGHIHMHPIVQQHVRGKHRQIHPRGRQTKHGVGKDPRKIEQRLL